MARWVRIDLEPSGRRPAALVATLAYAFLMLMLWLIIFQILEIDSIVGPFWSVSLRSCRSSSWLWRW